MATVNNFEDLEIWQSARLLCQSVYFLIISTELRNNYKLRDQIDGSSGSVMDNIAEGFERNGKKEFRQFLSIAKGSCGETRSQLYRIFDRGYIKHDKFEELKQQTLLLSKRISSFINYLNNSKYNGTKYKPPSTT